MFKTLKLIALTFAIIILSLLITYLSLPFILEKNVNTMTKTPVHIDAITFRPKHISVHKFIIKNPKCAEKRTALCIGSIVISSPLEDYIKKDMVVKSIELEDIYLNVELYNSQKTLGNWQTIMSNIKSDQPEISKVGQTSTLIKKVTLKNIEIDLMLFNQDPKMIHIPNMVFYNLKTDEGLPTKQIAKAVVSKVVTSLLIETGIKLVIESPANAIKGVFSPLFSPFDKKEKTGGEKATGHPDKDKKKPSS